MDNEALEETEKFLETYALLCSTIHLARSLHWLLLSGSLFFWKGL